MAKDAISVMDHLGWTKAHVFGHSMGKFMTCWGLILAIEPYFAPPGRFNLWHLLCFATGGMIACKLAALVPDRVLSLALLNVTGGGFQCLPKVWTMLAFI